MLNEKTVLKHFYGRRKLRPLHKGPSEALDIIGEKFLLPQQLLQQDAIDPKDFLPHPHIWLEIGFGNGEYLTGQALENPAVGMIGCEAFINGVAAAAKDIVTHDIQNIRLWNDDALPLLSRFADHSLDRIFLLFPDPWPKMRHYKRRFIQEHTVALFARLLKPGGRLDLATDDRPLAEWMLLHVVQNAQFTWDQGQNGDWATPPPGWIETRYQQKAAQQGRLACFLNFTKI